MTPEDKREIALLVWAFEHNGVQMRDRIQGIDVAANSVNNQINSGENAQRNALATWAFEQNGVQMRDRVYGTDIAANNVNNMIPYIMDAIQKVANENGVDISKIAAEVQKAVKESLEKIELEVKVNK